MSCANYIERMEGGHNLAQHSSLFEIKKRKNEERFVPFSFFSVG
jgi:hypothetical protein